MKLTRVNLYTVNYHGFAALDESVVVWSESAWDAARSFVATFPRDGAKVVHVMHPEGDENFRIDPEPEPVKAGWVPGPPPLDGQHYLVRVTGDPELPFDVVTKSSRSFTGAEPYEAACTFYYAEAITHHNPTPISLEIP